MVLRTYELWLLVAVLPSLINSDNTMNDKHNVMSNMTKQINPPICSKKAGGTRETIFVTILIFVFVIGLMGNGLAVTVILLSKTLRSQSTNLYVASLNLCDIGVILFTVPLRINEYLYGNFCFNIHVCRLFNVSDTFYHTSSISHLFVMAIERYIAVRIPFLFQRTIKKSVTWKVICMTWFYAALWAAASTVKWSVPSGLSSLLSIIGGRVYCLVENRVYWIVVYVVVYYVPLTIMAVLYFLILKTALEQQKTIASLSPSYLKQDEHQVKKKKQEFHASKTIAIIYGAFTVCWLPVTIISIILQTCPQCIYSFQKNNPTFADVVFTTFGTVFPAIHSCLNPFIYIIFHKRFRVAMKALLRGYSKLKHFDSSFRRRSSRNIYSRNSEVAL